MALAKVANKKDGALTLVNNDAHLLLMVLTKLKRLGAVLFAQSCGQGPVSRLNVVRNVYFVGEKKIEMGEDVSDE